MINPEKQNKYYSHDHRYTSNKGEIYILYPCYLTLQRYEIYCIKGSLFDDIERYDTLEEAEQRINELLE